MTFGRIAFASSLLRKFLGRLFCVWGASLCLTGCGFEQSGLGDSSLKTMVTTTTRIRGFDPVKAGDVPSANAIGKIYEGLLEYDYLQRPYQLIPALAESMPTISEDGLTYTFTIREGIRFQNDDCFTQTEGRGRECVAEDFVYSIKRVADLKTESTGYWAFNDRIIGLDEFRKNTGGAGETDYDATVEGLRAIDARTLQITLKRPYPQLLYILAMHYSFAVPREAVEFYGEEIVSHPVGTGPFQLGSWKRNYRVEFVRNPEWGESGRLETYPSLGEPEDEELGRLQDAGKTLPLLDRIIQYVVGDPQTQWLMFLSGQFDRYGGISRDNWDIVVSPDKSLDQKFVDKGITLWSEPTIDCFYLGFNMDDPILGQNKKLRQAMTAAFNTDVWIQFFNNRITPATCPVPPGLSGHLEESPPYTYDLGKAKALMVEAGYPDGIDPATGKRLALTIDIGSAQSSEMVQSTELFIDFMRKIGIEVSPQYNNWPAFLERMDRRQVQIYRLAWIADYPDAENFLQLFYGPNQSPGPNHSNYVNPKFDRLYERARILQESPERTAMYEHMSRIVMEDAPWILTHYRLSYHLNYSWLKNFKPHDFPYLNAKFLRVDDAERQRLGGGGGLQ